MERCPDESHLGSWDDMDDAGANVGDSDGR